jgi:hypothetical protein|tara:strand:- start:364 stop:543 length:180 start_codon:yes stop_codon:yes gene_type:complete
MPLVTFDRDSARRLEAEDDEADDDDSEEEERRSRGRHACSCALTPIVIPCAMSAMTRFG